MPSKQPKKEQPSGPPLEFRAIKSGDTHAVGFFVDGMMKHHVFTVERNEPRDVAARRLADAFSLVFSLGAELGIEVQKQEAAEQAAGAEDDESRNKV